MMTFAENVAETMPPRDFNKDFMRVSVRNTFVDVLEEDPWALDTKLNLRRQQTDSILHQHSILRDELVGSSVKEVQLPEQLPCSWKVDSLLPEFLTMPMSMPIGIQEEACATPDYSDEDSEETEAHQDASAAFRKETTQRLKPEQVRLKPEQVYFQKDTTQKLKPEQGYPEMETMRQVSPTGGGVSLVSGCTTVMMREVPLKYTQRKLLREINSSGFIGQYDYLYLPMDPRSHANRGFAFINLVSEKAAEEFHRKFHGQYLRHFSASVEKPIAVLPADLQGFEENALQYAQTAGRGKRTGHTKPVFLRSLPRHIEAKLNEGKPSAPTQPSPAPAAVAQRLPQRLAPGQQQQRPEQGQDAQQMLASMLQQALLPALMKASLSVTAPQAPQQPSFCCYCGNKRHPDHIFCGHCGRHFDA
jgi:hypothetical protein